MLSDRSGQRLRDILESIRTSVTPVDRIDSVDQKPPDEMGLDERELPYRFKKEMGPVAFKIKQIWSDPSELAYTIDAEGGYHLPPQRAASEAANVTM